MKDQKDIEKTGLHSYERSSFSNENSLANKPVYDFANKKTEKLVTALCMVTDCMETEDALKEKLRLLGVELLSHIYKLSTLLPVEKHLHIGSSLNHIYEILSFIEVANTIGYISDMNTNILKKEFHILIAELNQHLPKEKHFPFTLDGKMFQLSPEVLRTEGLSFNPTILKRTNNMSFINNKTNDNHVLYKTSPSIDYKKIKSDRSDKIISIIKDKANSFNGGASIKDISASFIDCSEKTIQRELNDLIEKGQIKKMGDKRWSRYSILLNK
jgi:hypothetical protein